MVAQIEKLMDNYTEVYQNVYQRSPRDLQILNEDWVLVNGAKMRITELEYLTQQLQLEYNEMRRQKRSLVTRLIQWFKN